MRSRIDRLFARWSEKQSLVPMALLLALLCLLLTGGCSRISTTVLPPVVLAKPQPPAVAMEPCPPMLPILKEDLEQIWLIDPSRVPREVLENEAIQGEQYRECVRKHDALILWVQETTTSPSP
jgi:hypothetical protein